MTIAEMLKQLRVENELTQKQLGESCLMKDSQIRRYENGYSIPSAKTLENILIIFNLADCIESKQKESIKFVYNFSFDTQKCQIYYFNLYRNFSCIIDPLKDKQEFNKLKFKLKYSINTIDKNNSVLFHASSCIDIKNKSFANESIIINDKLGKILLNKVNVLNDQGKQKAIDYMEDLAQIDKYKK